MSKMRCVLGATTHTFRERVLTMLQRRDIILGNATRQNETDVGLRTLTRIFRGLRKMVTVCSGTSCLKAIR